MIKLGLVLMLVTLVAAVALGLVNSRTAPVIAIQKELRKQNAMNEVAGNLSPGDSLAFDSLTVPGLENPYAICDETLSIVAVSVPPDTAAVGYVFIAYGKGYSSTIQTMVALQLDGTISNTTILFQQETPGLGANIETPSKLIEHFNGLRAGGCILTKDGGGIDAMTGCTITSRAVANSIRSGLEAMNEAGLFNADTPIAPDDTMDSPESDIEGDAPDGETEPPAEGGAA